MGARESRASILSYDEAVKRVTTTELKRVQEAYKRACGFAGVMREMVFIRDVLGDSVPLKLAQRIFAIMSSHSRGMTFRDLLVSLVVLTRGRREERLKLIYAVYCDDHSSSVTSRSMSNMVLACEKTALPHEAHRLFKHNDNVPYDQFRTWVLDYPNITSVTRWLVNSSGITVSLTDHMEMPNFYQTLAGVTHLDESDITELEKRYWHIKYQSKTGKFDMATLKAFVCPPLPEPLLQGLFNAFDENQDGHIDFKEISCGVSACCRGPMAERQKFCYKIFDADQDNKLNSTELRSMALGLLEVQKANCSKEVQMIEQSEETTESIVNSIVSHVLKHSNDGTDSITLEEYQLWSLEDPLPTILLNMVFEICHIVLGLRPSSVIEEGAIIRGWMHRVSNCDYKVNETWYVISGKWWNAWKQHTSYDPTLSSTLSARWEHFGEETVRDSTSLSSDTIGSAHEATEVMPHSSDKGSSSKSVKNRNRVPGNAQRLPSSVATFSSPGPINNSEILVEENTKILTLTDEGGKLKQGLREGVDYNILPEPVWKALHLWFGGTPELPRIVPAPDPDEKPWLELHRLHVVLLRHQVPSSIQQLSQVAFPGSGTMSGLGNTTLGMLKQSLNYVAGLNSNPKRVPSHRATFSKRHTVGQVSSFLSNRLRIPIDNMRLWHLLDENNANLLDDENVKLESIGIANNSQILLEVRNMDMSWPEELSQIARNHKQKLKQGQPGANQVTIVKGTTGLSNLGNTCFMNSSLQCISNTEPLTKYFVENKHLFELNKTNPLGMKGHIAKRYSDLAQDLWRGTNKTIAPLKVRWTISKYAPRFNGFSQHDSQELLAFLLDGLHEDLNRVHVKPYVELKDSDGRPDEEVAEEAWENHLSRNQSIIIDLFHGQIRSRVHCMECGAVSVRFDPFTFLSLPLPMDNLMYFDVIAIRLSGETPIRYGLRLSMDDTFLEVRKLLASKCNIPIEALLLTEVLGATIKTFLSDHLKVRTSTLGSLYAYEIPPPPQRSIAILGSRSPNVDKKSNGLANHPPATPDVKVSSNEVVTSFKSHIGSSVHETHKRTITNHSALHIQPTNIPTSVSSPAVIESSAATDAKDNKESELGDNTAPLRSPPAKNVARESGFSSNSVNGNNRNPVTTRSSSMKALGAGDTDSDDFPSYYTDADNFPGFVIAFHRKILHLDVYFLSSQKHRPSLFGLPIVVPYLVGQPKRMLYSAVWKLVSRFVSPLPPAEVAAVNHAQDCDDSLGSQYPFTLQSVTRSGMACGNNCPWFRFCKGCVIPCNDKPWKEPCEYIAIDWDPTALHLRYQPSVEKDVTDDVSVQEGHRGQQQRIDLNHCLRAFTQEEELGKDELYHCGKCKKPQLAKKKLDIWRLPPILIIHLKRFQYVNGRWIKSHKVVDFPRNDFDPSSFMTKRDEEDTMSPVCGENDADVSTDSEEGGADGDQKSSTVFKKGNKDHHISFDDAIDDIHAEERDSKNTAEDSQTQASSGNSNAGSSKPVHSVGTARTRKPSFRENSTPLYDLFAVSCHSGILGGGHYVAFAKNHHTKKWYCYNDSSCKEVPAESISVETAYTLFYQRQDLDCEEFMPETQGKDPLDTASMDDDYNSEFKKYCVIQ